MREYYTVCEHPSDFDDKVNEKLKEGWELYESPFVHPGDLGYWTQALTREVRVEEEGEEKKGLRGKKEWRESYPKELLNNLCPVEYVLHDEDLQNEWVKVWLPIKVQNEGCSKAEYDRSKVVQGELIKRGVIEGKC